MGSNPTWGAISSFRAYSQAISIILPEHFGQHIISQTINLEVGTESFPKLGLAAWVAEPASAEAWFAA